MPLGARHGIDLALAGTAGALAVIVMLAARVVFGEPVIQRGEAGSAMPSATRNAPAQIGPIEIKTIAPARTPQPSDRSGSNRGRG